MNDTLQKSVARNYGIRIPALLAFPITFVVVFMAIPSGWKQGMSAFAWVFVVPCFAAVALLLTAVVNQYIVLLKFRSKQACFWTGAITLIPVSGVAVLALRLLYPEMF